ncbi:dUTP diphosphatase [Burkholderia ubonensis]|uniref:dUTP diphosphatase n=1 Tax=Burkholderia ubonensis TaxID=101571 RepID=UPI0007C70DED|nr:dUTP diphosphatase [Burkholderia ubonensis]
MTTLKIKRVHPDAKIPQFATAGAACIDLHAIEADAFKPHPTDKHACIFRTGLAVEIPSGFVLKIYSRSGHGFKDAIRLSNCVGVIDSDYRGEIMVSLRADGESCSKVRTGDRIAQAMLEIAPRFEIVEVDELSETARGEGGFGSTGTGAISAETAALGMVQYTRDDESIQCALMLVGSLKEVPLDVIAKWTLDQCIEAHDWALAVHLSAADNDHVKVPPRPPFLNAYVMAAEERYASLGVA